MKLHLDFKIDLGKFKKILKEKYPQAEILYYREKKTESVIKLQNVNINDTENIYENIIKKCISNKQNSISVYVEYAEKERIHIIEIEDETKNDRKEKLMSETKNDTVTAKEVKESDKLIQLLLNMFSGLLATKNYEKQIADAKTQVLADIVAKEKALNAKMAALEKKIESAKIVYGE